MRLGSKGAYSLRRIKYVPCPPDFLAMARTDGWVAQHPLMVALEIGRALLRSECVHHINGNPEDNRIENLMLFASNADHKRYEHGQPIEPLWRLSPR